MSRITLGIMAALVFALGAMGLLYRAEVRTGAENRDKLKTAVQALQGVVEQRKADQRTLAAWQAVNAVQARKLADAQQGLQKALQGVSAWSEATVPTTVQDALLSDSERPKYADK
jgi:hypothetical protein